MIYIFEDGRIIYDKSLLTKEDIGKFIEFSTIPEVTPVAGKIGTITGVNLKTKEVIINYFDIIPIPTPPTLPEYTNEITETEQLMQSLTDAELRDLVIQQNQELLAQQMTDIEVALLGGGK